MKKIVVKIHAIDRIQKRFPKFNSRFEFEKFIHSRKQMISNGRPIAKPYKVNLNYNTIPITIVVVKSHTRINVITAYVNDKKKKGKFIKKQVEHEKRIKRHNQQD